MEPHDPIGLPAYANAAPIAVGLRAAGVPLVRATMAELNQRLLSGGLDLSLVSAAFALRHAGRLAILPGGCIAAAGPVHSVLVLRRRPWHALRRIAVTVESASSVALLRLLLERDGIDAELTPTPQGTEALDTHDAVLLIGDRALQALAVAPGRYEVTDLAERWHAQTGLPFVFGVWAYRRGAPPAAEVHEAVAGACFEAPREAVSCVRPEAARLGVPTLLIVRHLNCLRYRPAVSDERGLNAFADAVVCNGQWPRPATTAPVGQLTQAV